MIPQYAEELRALLRHLASSGRQIAPFDHKGLLKMTDEVLEEFKGLSVQARVDLRTRFSAFFTAAHELGESIERARMSLFRPEDATSPPEVVRMAAERAAREARGEKWTTAPTPAPLHEWQKDLTWLTTTRDRDGSPTEAPMWRCAHCGHLFGPAERPPIREGCSGVPKRVELDETIPAERVTPGIVPGREPKS